MTLNDLWDLCGQTSMKVCNPRAGTDLWHHIVGADLDNGVFYGFSKGGSRGINVCTIMEDKFNDWEYVSTIKLEKNNV